MVKINTYFQPIERPVFGRSIKSNLEFNATIKPFSNPPTPITVEIKTPTDVPPLHFKNENLELPNGLLSFQIEADDVIKIMSQIVNFVRNPERVSECLQKFDKKLGQAMNEADLHFTDSDLPSFLLASNSSFMPGPPPPNYRPCKKAMLLDKLLLEEEMKHQINLLGSVKFVGVVPQEIADAHVAKGNLFTESKDINRMLHHGVYSHRLIFIAIAEALNLGYLDFKLSDNRTLSLKQLLELMIKVFDHEKQSNFWGMLIDTFSDRSPTKVLDPKSYNFSCRSPTVLNSMILGFGKELGLANLQHYLLDSHWKAAYEMVHKIKTETKGESKEHPDDLVYSHCIQAFATMHENPNLIGSSVSFTKTVDEVLSKTSHQPVSNASPNIVKRTKATQHAGRYHSWQDFFDYLDAKKLPGKEIVPEKFGMFSQLKPLEQEKILIIKKYKINPSSSTQLDLNEALRRATTLSDTDDIKKLVNNFNADPQAETKTRISAYEIALHSNKQDILALLNKTRKSHKN